MITGCTDTVDTPDGKIPAQYLAQAQQFVGSYPGQFNGLAGTLTITLNDATPTLQFKANDGGTDILGGKCHSVIGKLVDLKVQNSKDNSGTFVGADFAFDSGQCQNIEGQTIEVDFSKDDHGTMHADASIFEYSVTTHNCLMVKGGGGGDHDGDDHGGHDNDHDGDGHQPIHDPIDHCTPDTTNFYLNGSFTH